MFRATLESPDLDHVILAHLTEALTRIDLEYLRRYAAADASTRSPAGGPLPPLYGSGVRYAREPSGAERWSSAPLVLWRGAGDCEDLACWRAAELRMHGDVAARVVSTSQQLSPSRRLFHVLVRRGDGRLEDPSRRLGMPDLTL